MPDYANPEALVEAGWVVDHLNDPGVRLVEIDVDTTSYDQGHIPGAVGWNWQTQLQQGVVRDLLDKAGLEQLLGASGIGNDTTVVLYGDNNNWFAAWAYWQLKYYGHRDVRLLDGGRVKWVADGRPLTTDAPNVAAMTYTAAEPDASIRALRSHVEANLGTAALVDVRSPREFSGELLAPENLPQEGSQRGRSHPRRRQHRLGAGGAGGRHLQVRRRTDRGLRPSERHRGQTGDRLLPDRRARRAHLVRPERTPRLPKRPQL